MNLCTRDIPVDPHFPRCGNIQESIELILLTCPFACSVWLGCSLSHKVPEGNGIIFHEWINGWKIFSSKGKKASKELISLCTFICWHLWLARNDFLYGKKVWSPLEVIQVAENHFKEYYQSIFPPHRLASTSLPTAFLVFQCEQPPANYFKSNCDASLRPRSMHGCLGIICRDHQGRPYFAISDLVQFQSALVGEAIAIHSSLLEAISEDITHVVVENDNKDVIIYLNNGTSSASLTVNAILEDILHLKTYFGSCIFSFVPREFDSLANSLVRRALSVMGRTVWPISDP
ncbi:uncharacterized protein LOC122084769 [Macadamia integrifolia]|uniref:uncharacterized protein LOC122084769 n=1 Tax=Macadamia integrifolia TaxID=60698 RepID=UPI001C4EE647|nr:uncharacterized protein LOC122084769 [Macadamia integrifolia]